MKVVANGEEYSCTKAVKGADYVELYNGTEKVIEFSGIKSFSGYSVEGGSWTIPTKTVNISREDFELLDSEDENTIYYIADEDGTITIHKGVNE